jgi:hypothetical protein
MQLESNTPAGRYGPRWLGKLIELERPYFSLGKTNLCDHSPSPTYFPKSPGMNHSFLDFYEGSLVDVADLGAPRVERPEE